MAKRFLLAFAALLLGALATGSASAQTVNSIYMCANYAGTALTTAQLVSNTCAATNGAVIKGGVFSYSYGASRPPTATGTPPGSLQVSGFSFVRPVDTSGAHLTGALLNGANIGTLAFGVNVLVTSSTTVTEVNQLTIVLQGVTVVSDDIGGSASGATESFSVNYTHITIYDNVAGTKITY